MELLQRLTIGYCEHAKIIRPEPHHAAFHHQLSLAQLSLDVILSHLCHNLDFYINFDTERVVEVLTLNENFTLSSSLEMSSVAHEPPLHLRSVDEVCRKCPVRGRCLTGSKTTNTSQAPQSEEDWQVHKQTICDIYMSSTVVDVMTRMELEHGFKATFVFITSNALEMLLIIEV